MKKQNKRFALRVYSRFPVQMSMVYQGPHSAGRGIVLEISRVGCRILGTEPVLAGETMSLKLSLPTSQKPMVIEQAIVKWVKGLEFGIAFKHLPMKEANELQRLLEELLGSGPNRGVPARQHALRA
jgi:PilZ domain-containing protein